MHFFILEVDGCPHAPRNTVYSKEMKAAPDLNTLNVLQSLENELHFIFTCIMMNNTDKIYNIINC